jgi:RNA polymerase sigma factor (sigma-70 family)
MARGPLQSVVQLMRKTSVSGGDAPPSGELLRRFVANREEAAFAGLVEEHGPMVLGVCRRVLKNRCDVEDAFQAAFMVLAAKARSISRPEMVATWLYRVAFRVALRARAEAGGRPERQAAREDVAAEREVADVEWADLRAVLDEEIDRLPEKYRVPVVLCYFEGKTNEEAARQLGCAKGTVFSRLASARERLRNRLVRRGITLSAAIATTVFSADVLSAAVTAPLRTVTVRAALSFLSEPAMPGAASTIGTALAKGTLQTMLFTRVRTIVVVLVVLGLVGTGAGTVALQPWAGAHPRDAQPREAQPLDAQPQDRPGGAGEQTPRKDRTADQAGIAGAQSKDQPAPGIGNNRGSSNNARLLELLKKRRDAAQTALDTMRKRVQTGSARFDTGSFVAALRLLESELDLCQTPAERLKAHEGHLQRVSLMAAMIRRQHEAGLLPADDGAVADFYLLDAEIRLERAKSKSATTP